MLVSFAGGRLCHFMSDNFGRNRNIVILGLGIAILAIVLLATTLLNSGWDTKRPSDPISYQSESLDAELDIDIFTPQFPIATAMLMLIVVSIIAVLRYPGYTLRMMFATLVVTVLLSLFLERLPTVEPLEGEGTTEEVSLEELAQGTALETVEVSSAPPWLNNAIAISISVVVVTILVGIVLTVWRRDEEVSPLPQIKLAEQAKETLYQIETGFDLRNAVLNCYAQMLDTVRQDLGVMRRKNVTPHEFEDVLIKHGLPQSAVQRMTRLFETVRYGVEEPGPREQREAVDCLNEIITATETYSDKHASHTDNHQLLMNSG
ncbi:MAG: DUF4129 domain-containing protein [Candidatus Promineifilaceae bacterium]